MSTLSFFVIQHHIPADSPLRFDSEWANPPDTIGSGSDRILWKTPSSGTSAAVQLNYRRVATGWHRKLQLVETVASRLQSAASATTPWGAFPVDDTTTDAHEPARVDCTEESSNPAR